jgi:hypothetical protein
VCFSTGAAHQVVGEVEPCLTAQGEALRANSRASKVAFGP